MIGSSMFMRRLLEGGRKLLAELQATHVQLLGHLPSRYEERLAVVLLVDGHDQGCGDTTPRIRDSRMSCYGQAVRRSKRRDPCEFDAGRAWYMEGEHAPRGDDAGGSGC